MSAREAIHNRIHGEGYCEPPCSLCREVADLIDDLADEECDAEGVIVPDTGTYLVVDGRVIEGPTCGEGCTGWGCSICNEAEDEGP